MEAHELRNVIEALLFAADEPLSLARIRDILSGEDGKAVRAAVEALRDEYAAAARGIQIEEIANGYRLLSNLRYAPFVEQLHKAEKRGKITQAGLETLAIIAYKQPIHRADIEAIRGVAVDSILRTLQDRALIRIVGRADVLGRPFLYGTTKRFLEAFGLKSLDDLPSVEELHIP